MQGGLEYCMIISDIGVLKDRRIIVMIDEEYYDMIFKRKSFRRFNDILKLSNGELYDIEKNQMFSIPCR